jgi:acyl-CoA hydrolase/RimJ/RimL family protein N-acetyltransferase
MNSRWLDRYRGKLINPEEAMHKIAPGSHIFVGTACGEPQALTRALGEKGERIDDAELSQFVTLSNAPYAQAQFAYRFRPNTFFIGPGMRDAVSEGRADYIPMMLSEIPSLIKSGRVEVDVALIQVTAPDEHGYCSLGVSIDITKAAAEAAILVIAQVNPRMPRTLGDSFIHVDDLDFVVEHEEPVLEYTYAEPQRDHLKIAENVAKLVENESTIEMGIGIVPNLVPRFLVDRKDLAIHTETFSEGLVDLIEKGVVTGRKKTIHQGKIVASFAMGTKRLYDLINNNAMFEFHPADYTNSPSVIAQNHKMVAINVALEVDLTGQVNADSIGPRFYSGIGGQADFMRGAALCRNGKPIIALPSTAKPSSAKGGTVSRIVPRLTEGAGVTTTRGDVHYVVTEYGIASLHGKNIRERAMALINIAHPDFREGLLAGAKEMKYIYQDQKLPPSAAIYPEELETFFRARDGTRLFVRPLRVEDEETLKNMFYTLSDKSRYLRFFSAQRTLPHARAQLEVLLDYDERMAIGVFEGEPPGERMVGVARYVLVRATNFAEVAFEVPDAWHNRGIGTFLVNDIIQIAKKRGITGFTAMVMAENRKMMSLLHKAGYKLKTRIEEGAYEVEFRFDEPQES